MNRAEPSALTVPDAAKYTSLKSYLATHRQQQETVTRWSDDEWETFAGRLDALYPHWTMMTSPDLMGLNLRMLNEVGATMERPRAFAAVGAPRAKLLKAFQRLREARFHRAPAPSAPVTPLAKVLDGDRPRLVKPAPHTPAAVATAGALPDTKVGDWTRDEWLAVVTKIHEAFPLANYPLAASAMTPRLVGLDSEDVAFAQRVLPFERQVRHLKIVSFAQLRPPLVSALRDLHNRLVSAAASAPKPMPVAPPAAPAVVSLGEVEAACAPLLTLLARMLTAQMRPMLTDLLLEVLPLVMPLPSAPEPAPPAATAPPPAQAVAVTKRPAEPAPAKIRPPTIGVFGNRTADKTEMEREFPGVEFSYIDSAKQIEKIRNCDKVIVMLDWIGHSASNIAKKAAGERHVPLRGAIRDVKRQVQLWINSGEIVPRP